MLLALMLLACSTGTQAQPLRDTPQAQRSTPEGPALLERDRVRRGLFARHVEDLPTADDLGPDAHAVLMDLATTDDHLLVRRRALVLLGDYPSPETAAFCLEQTNSDVAQLRAAGRGLPRRSRLVGTRRADPARRCAARPRPAGGHRCCRRPAAAPRRRVGALAPRPCC